MSPLMPDQRPGGEDWSIPELVRTSIAIADEVRQTRTELKEAIAGMRSEFVPRETVMAWRQQSQERFDALEKTSSRQQELIQSLAMSHEAEKTARLETEAARALERSRFIFGQVVTVALAVAALAVTVFVAYIH